jgi:DnaK suppressor protein
MTIPYGFLAPRMNMSILRPEASEFERRLRARSSTLRAEIRDALLRNDAEQYAQIAGEVHDAEDAALADLLVDVNLAEITRHVQEIRDIDAALRRITMGTFAVCVRCGEPISRDRLQAYPTAKRCLPCQQTYDRARMATSSPSL